MAGILTFRETLTTAVLISAPPDRPPVRGMEVTQQWDRVLCSLSSFFRVGDISRSLVLSHEVESPTQPYNSRLAQQAFRSQSKKCVRANIHAGLVYTTVYTLRATFSLFCCTPVIPTVSTVTHLSI
jgi:hypothetical protein